MVKNHGLQVLAQKQRTSLLQIFVDLKALSETATKFFGHPSLHGDCLEHCSHNLPFLLTGAASQPPPALQLPPLLLCLPLQLSSQPHMAKCKKCFSGHERLRPWRQEELRLSAPGHHRSGTTRWSLLETWRGN